MNEFRIPSHNKRYDRKAVNKLVFMILILVSLLFLFIFYFNEWSKTLESTPTGSLEYMPDPKDGVVYNKLYFSLSYVERYELPEWVTYELTAEMMNKPKFKRDQDFNPDPAISTGSGHYHDYKNSGYRRGHLVPAGDMSWNKQAMDATFLLSNVAPMTAKFNDGIWSELEKDVRDWARAYQKIYVVAGPVFRNPITTIGENEITVPGYFYKAVFALKDGEPKVIGFLFDQKRQSYGPLSDYIVPIDSIEKETGIDLFANLYGSWDAEIAYEKQRGISTGDWLFNERWYAERLNEEMKNTK